MMNYLHCLLGLHISFHIDSFTNASFTPASYLSKSDFHKKAPVSTQHSGLQLEAGEYKKIIRIPQLGKEIWFQNGFIFKDSADKFITWPSVPRAEDQCHQLIGEQRTWHTE